MASNYPFSTTWTGAGDGTSWSDPGNWSNGVPLSGAPAPAADQDIATIDNSVATTPYTVTIAGTQNAGEIDVNATDPVGGVAVSLTGTLNMPINQSNSGSGFGQIDLDAGTFEIDGGTLSVGEVTLKGGTLAFGSYAQWGDDTINASIIDGPLTIGNGATVVVAPNGFAIFDGDGGYGTPADVVITDNATLSVQGSLTLSGEIDVQQGTLSFDGGGLSGWGGSALLYADGGAIDVTQNASVYNAYTIEGSLTFTNPVTMTVTANGDLTLGSDSLGSRTVVNLDGGTLDVSGALNLDNTLLENGTLILEAGSTYTSDSLSLQSGITLIDNRPAGQTNWTGAAGDGDWSNAANWSAGVPQSGLDLNSDGQSIAVINNIVATTPATIVISGNVNAQDVDLATTDPNGAPSISLTGTLDLAWGGANPAYGQLNLGSGTFEIDGGTLAYAGVGLNGGNLAFGTNGQATLQTDIINGNFAIGSSLVVTTGYDVFHGSGGGGPGTVTLQNGAELLVTPGTLALDGEIDIQDSGGQGTLFSLDGGNLLGYGGDAATIFIDGGTFAVDQNTTLLNAVDIYGGYMVLASGVTATIDASSTTTIGQAGAGLTTLNLDGGTLDVFGTLDLTNTYVENGTIIVESGATFTQDPSATLSGVTLVGVATTATNWTGAGDGTNWSDPNNWDNGVPLPGATYLNLGQNVTTIDNAHGDTNPFTVVISGAQYGALVIVNATDPTGGVAVSLQGSLDLGFDSNGGSTTLGVLDLNAGTFEVDGGTLNVLNVNQNNTTYNGNITFGSFAQWGAATLNASGIAGSFTIDNGSDLVIAQYSFGAFNAADGVTPDDVSIEDNSTLDIKGSLGSGNNIDIYSGTVNLDGGTLSMGNGAKMISEGGGFTVTGDGTFKTVTYDGALTLTAGNTLTIAAGYTATLNNLGNQYTINLSGGTVDVQGTLDVEGLIENSGNLTLENGSTLIDATVNAAYQFDDPTVTINGSATLDNVTIDAPITMNPAAGANILTITGDTTFGNAADPAPMQVNLNGGVIEVTGTLNLVNTDITDGTIIIEQGGTLNSDAASQLTAVTVERTLANGDLSISGENVVINAQQSVTTAQNIDLATGVNPDGSASGTPGEVTFASPAGFTGAGLVTVTDANGVSKTDFGQATLDANVAGETLTYQTDTWLPDYGSFTAENGATLAVGDAANASANLTDGVFDGSIAATGGSTATFYAAQGIAVVNGTITLDNTSTIQVATPGGDVALAQSLTSIGSQNPTTYLDQSGILNLDNGASFIDPNAVTLYGTVNLTGGTFSTAGLTGNAVVYNYGFGGLYPSGVDGYGTLDGPFGSSESNINMQATGGTLTFNGTLTGEANLIASANSTLIVNAAIDNDGSNYGYDANIGDGATIDLAGPITDASGLYVDFQGNNATLTLADPVGQRLNNIYVQGTYLNDVIDLTGLTAATLAGGAPDVTITRTSNGSVTVTIVPLGGGAADTFVINGATNTKVTFNPDDGNGGSQILMTANPVITAPGAADLTQGFAGAISGISLADLGLAAGQTITATLTDTTGLLSATGTVVSGSGTTTLTVTGTLDQVNAALATLTVEEAGLGYDGLYVSAVDSAGNSANTQGVQIYIEAPIVIGALSNQSISRDVATHFIGPYVFEQGALSGADLTVTVSDTTGILTASGTGISGSGTNTLTISGSQSVVAAELVAMTITEATPGTDTVTFNATDAAGDHAQTASTVISTFSSPVATLPANIAVAQNSITPLTGLSVSEPGALSYEQFTVTLSDASGLLSANGSTATGLGATSITLTGSLAQISADLATLTLDDPNTGSDTLHMTVTDQYGGTSSTSAAITSTHAAAPDLTVGTIVAPAAAIEGQTVQLTWTVTNSGDATATGPWSDNVYLATDAAGTNRTLVGSFVYNGTLTPGQSETETQTITIPADYTVSAQTGTTTTYFVVQADANNQTGALSGVQNHITVASTPTATTEPVGWNQVLDLIQPATADSSDYALFEQRFIAEVGTTAASYSAAVANAIATLDQQSGTVASYGDAVNLLVDKAFSALGDQALAQVTTPSGSSTGLDALLTPSYDSDLSNRNSAGVFGDGWSSELNDVGPLGPMNGLDPQYHNPGGAAYVVTYITTYVDQNGNYLGQTTTYQVVAPASYGIDFLDPSNPYSNYTQTNANGTIETFSGVSGLLIGISDGKGNAITINRNSTGVITSIATASGHPPVFSVNAQGQITGATDSAGNTITYAYDASGTHLLSTTTAAGTTSYQYSTSANAFITNALTQVTNPDGTTQSYTYNAQGDLASTSTNGAAATTYTYSGLNTVTRTNGDGQATTYTYDANGQPVAVTDADGNTFTLQHDASGKITSITTATGQTSQYSYDPSGNLTSFTDPLGNTVHETYSATTSALTSVTDQNGNVTQYQYNAARQLSGIAQANGTGPQYQYNAAGLVSEETEASGATIQFTYNAAGQVTHEAFSDGTSQSYTYAANGNLTSATAVDGGVTTYAYNAQGLLSSVTNAAGQVERYSYNAAGQETQRIEPDGSITNYTYTASGKLAQITDGSGTVMAAYTYDAVGALVEKDTGNGARTLYSYNPAGNLTEIKTLASDGSTTSKLDYTYDADGRIATATSGDGIWTYTYDANNQVTHAVFASTNASIASQDLAYDYDAAGNRTQTIFNGATTNYSTNNLNQYTSADGTTYGYDANGNLITKVSGGATTTYTYNIQNQLTSSTDASGTTTYTYDALGNIASQTVNGVKTSYVSDPLAISSSATGPLSAVAQAYNASGQATATYIYGNGLTAVTSSGTTSYYNADASGNITSLSGANGALVDTYAYTPSGTLLSSTGNTANQFQFNGLSGAITQGNGLVDTGARYYDPTTGRFISQDPTGQSGGINLYTYAANNSINFIDANGDAFSPSQFLFGIGSIALTLAVGAAAVATAPVSGTVFILGGIGTGAYQIYKSQTKDGNGIYVDSNTEVTTNLVTTGLSAIPGGGKVTSTVQLVLSGLSSTDIFDPNTAYDYYFPNRTVKNTVTVNVPIAGGHGDVHLTTFDGLHFDFQAVGEFLLTKSIAAGDNFQVQIRLSALGGNENSPTYTTEIGIEVGDQTVTFGTDRAATVWLDGAATDLSQSANTLTLAGGTISELSQNTYQVTEKTGEIVDITNNGSYFDYTIDLAPGAKPGSVVGLLGSYTGTANAFQLPDGTALGSTLTSVQLYQTFGNAWRITDGTSLLNYAPGETTATYTDLAHPTSGLPVSSLPTAVVQAATAAVAAAGLTGQAATDAIYDYLITGDPSVIANAAADGAAAPVTSNAVVTPSAPPPPSIGISPATPTVNEVSGQTPVTFTVSLTSAATANTEIDYAVSAAAIDSGKTYFNAADFGGTLPTGTLTILAGQSQAQFTVDVPDSALGTTPDKWLAVAISTPGADPIYAATAQVDVINETPVAGIAAQPLLEYVPGNAIGATQNAPSLTQSGNSYVLNLGNVVQGTSVAALQFALANTASAPADGLSALSLGASGSGFDVAGLGSATLISAGNSVTAATVQPLTANLGAQSTVVTLGATDVNVTGYAGTLPQITLTVTENVIAAAQAAVSTSAIALPDVRVGSSDSQTITVTNTAAAGAAPLDVTLGAATGATASGAISQLAAGASDSTSLSVGLATTTAGLQSSFVTLNLASDLGNGVSAPLPLNKSVTLTGSVYRAAAATITQSATVVHVGDAASQTLSIANSDPADGYSEGLRATVTGDTGNIVASGTTALIAAGTSDTSSVTVSYSTATAGVVSGQIDLGLTSDGTGVDSLAPISLGTDVTPFSVQVDNYATADLQETSGGGTLTGTAATGYTLDLGTIAQGSGPDTIGLAALNSASGLADLLAGSFAITGDSAFANSGFAGFSGLGAGQADNALSVSLSTQNDGTFSETITLTGTGSNASGYSGTVAPVTLTIEGQVASDTPDIAGGSFGGAITEQAATTGSSSLDTAQGTIDFTDANLTASHTASVLSVAASGVTTGLPGNAALLSLLSLGTLAEDTASNPGSVAWNFAAADATFDYLAAGETLTLSYAVQIAETGGRSATQNVTVTVTGTNDLPQIAAGTTASATLTEIVAGPHNPASDTASGMIRFTDADLSDTHTASVVSVSASGATAGLAGNATLLGLLSTGAPTEPSGATAGSVGWNFAAPDATFAYLIPGQTVTLTYTVDISDNHGGTVAQAVTVNVTGAPGKVVHSATSGTISGMAYASVDSAYTAVNFRYLETFYDASGNVLATEAFTANGGYTVTIGGIVTLSKTANADGSYVMHYTTPGTILGTAFASSDNSHTAAGPLDSQTFYDASGNVVATETYQPNGGYTITTGGVVRQIKTGNADGSSVIETENVVGQAYTEKFAATDHTGTLIATSTTLTNGSNSTVVYGTGQTFSDVAGVASISDAADTFQLGPDAHGTLNITGAANATLAFGTGDGAQIITGFATSGPGADVLSFSSNVFADYAHLMNATRSQGNDLLITLDASDTLLLKNVSMANFSSSNAKFT